MESKFWATCNKTKDCTATKQGQEVASLCALDQKNKSAKIVHKLVLNVKPHQTACAHQAQLRLWLWQGWHGANASNSALQFLFLYNGWNHCFVKNSSFVKDWSSCQSSTRISNDYINLLCHQLHQNPLGFENACGYACVFICAAWDDVKLQNHLNAKAEALACIVRGRSWRPARVPAWVVFKLVAVCWNYVPFSYCWQYRIALTSHHRKLGNSNQSHFEWYLQVCHFLWESSSIEFVSEDAFKAGYWQMGVPWCQYLFLQVKRFLPKWSNRTAVSLPTSSLLSGSSPLPQRR